MRRNRENARKKKRQGQGNRMVLRVLNVKTKWLGGTGINPHKGRLHAMLFMQEFSSALNHAW